MAYGVRVLTAEESAGLLVALVKSDPGMLATAASVAYAPEISGSSGSDYLCGNVVLNRLLGTRTTGDEEAVQRSFDERLFGPLSFVLRGEKPEKYRSLAACMVEHFGRLLREYLERYPEARTSAAARAPV